MVNFLSIAKGHKRQLLAGALLLASQLNLNAQCSTTGWKKVAQGENFSVGLKDDGSLWLWGYNNYGLSGNGTGQYTEIQHPWKMAEVGSGWTDVQAGNMFILAKKANGDLYGWGRNNLGQLGTGDTTEVISPKLIMQNVSTFSAGYDHTMVVKTDGTMWATGNNGYWGGLGLGSSAASTITTFQQEATKATNWSQVTATYYNSFGIKTDGSLWVVGTNVEGETGLGEPGTVGNYTFLFTQLGTDKNWKSVVGGVYHTLGLKSNGELWAWGHNNNGRLGIGSTGGIKYTPQQVAGNNWSSVGATNDASSAIKSDGSLWTWGSNANGKLGIGTSADVNVPTKVGTGNNWKSIPVRSGVNSSAGITSDTSVFSWGWDGYWQLGNEDGSQTSSSVPTKVTCTDNLAVNDINSAKQVAVYPNPAKDFVIVQSSSKNVAEVKIYNTAGSLVKTISKVADNKINVSDLQAGVYILKIDGAESVKLIKK